MRLTLGVLVVLLSLPALAAAQTETPPLRAASVDDQPGPDWACVRTVEGELRAALAGGESLAGRRDSLAGALSLRGCLNVASDVRLSFEVAGRGATTFFDVTQPTMETLDAGASLRVRPGGSSLRSGREHWLFDVSLAGLFRVGDYAVMSPSSSSAFVFDAPWATLALAGYGVGARIALAVVYQRVQLRLDLTGGWFARSGNQHALNGSLIPLGLDARVSYCFSSHAWAEVFALVRGVVLPAGAEAETFVARRDAQTVLGLGLAGMMGTAYRDTDAETTLGARLGYIAPTAIDPGGGLVLQLTLTVAGVDLPWPRYGG